jgi:membrane-anchored protein YejM (alkaline phosphatase superfamily)
MPLYAQLYSTSSQSVELALPPPVEHTTRERWLRDVSRARTPKHVLYVLLESFRADALEPEAAPAMWQLAQQSRWYTHALAEATYTPLSWSVLLFDETASDNLFGRHSGRPEPLGGYLFALMDHASIQPHLFASTNLSYAKTRQRLLGAHGKLDLFQAAADVGEDPFDKNHNDRLVVDHTVDFIRTQSWSEPQLMMLQLDSTHYTYPFPEDDAVFTPYSENLMLPRPIETDEEARLLRNRYRNAVHFVDAQLARVMHALKDAGVYDDMLIVLTADHGEGLAPGLQGHAAVAEVTKRVPLLIRVPGQPAERIDTLVSHRDVLPTLTGLLGIDVPAGTLRGAPLEARATDNAVFTLAPSGRFGQLTLPDYVVDLRLVYRATSVIVTPAAIHGPYDAATRTRAEREWVQRLSEFLQVSPTARAVVEASASAQN